MQLHRWRPKPRVRDSLFVGISVSAIIAILIAVPALTSATTYVNITSGWNTPIQNTQATSTCTGSNGWNINDVSTTTGKGQEFAYSESGGSCYYGGTESKTVFMGIYGSQFTWNQATGHYSYYVTWNVSYNISMSMTGSPYGSSVASTYLIIKTNLYDTNNLTNEWPNGASGTMNNPSISYPTLSYSHTYSQSPITFNPAGTNGLYLINGNTYSIWSEMILESLAYTPWNYEDNVLADIDMQSNSQYGQIVSFVIST
ncbi:MAG: hypothetical protein L3K16_09505 [Thermoplasmata archaeon]|nr:hypothetical protein [Thermoplasmata archaeon]